MCQVINSIINFSSNKEFLHSSSNSIVDVSVRRVLGHEPFIYSWARGVCFLGLAL